jgi:hypothetical protein
MVRNYEFQGTAKSDPGASVLLLVMLMISACGNGGRSDPQPLGPGSGRPSLPEAHLAMREVEGVLIDRLEGHGNQEMVVWVRQCLDRMRTEEDLRMAFAAASDATFREKTYEAVLKEHVNQMKDLDLELFITQVDLYRSGSVTVDTLRGWDWPWPLNALLLAEAAADWPGKTPAPPGPQPKPANVPDK